MRASPGPLLPLREGRGGRQGIAVDGRVCDGGLRTATGFAAVLLSVLGALEAAAREGRTPGPKDEVLFTFAVFGDNKRAGKEMRISFANMKRIKPSFIIGMGDHFVSKKALREFDACISAAFGSTDAFYRRFYLTPGDDEAGAYAGRQDARRAAPPRG